jgi:dienelactone hydrolase
MRVKMRALPFAVWAVAVGLGLFGTVQMAQEKTADTGDSIIVTEMRLPTHGSGKKGLEAVMVRPADGKPHPLALMTHGTPRDPTDRPEMTPLRWLPQAREFARRGWTAVIVMRRGFGDSGGGYSEAGGACSNHPDVVGPTKEAVKDLREATEYIKTLPEVDASARMIGVGISSGGLAMVGLASDPPDGMVTTISFAGGRGSDAPDHVCNANVVVNAFEEFGKHAKVPMLWVYAENDHFFGPQLAQAFYQAYEKAGGKAQFVATGPFGDDGHGLFSLRGIPVWTPIVDQYLKSEGLALRDTPLPLKLPNVAEPPELPTKAREDFPLYLQSAPHKAMAVSGGGHHAFVVGRRNTEEAEKQAMANCKKNAGKDDPCTVVMVDDQRK